MRYGLPFVAVVGNDAAWNAEYQIQLRDYGPDRLFECELLPSRYDRVAAALGGHGAHVASMAELGPMLRDGLEQRAPGLRQRSYLTASSAGGQTVVSVSLRMSKKSSRFCPVL